MAETLTYGYRDFLFHSRKSEQGFTLVELLLALAILGLATSVVILNVPAGGQQSKREAERFAARIIAASDEAVSSGSVIGLDFTTSSYQFLKQEGDRWTPIGGRVLSAWNLDAEIGLQITIEKRQSLKENDEIISGGGSIAPRVRDSRRLARTQRNPFEPVIEFRPIGNGTQLEAIFSGRTRSWQVVMDEAGRVSLMRYDTL